MPKEKLPAGLVFQCQEKGWMTNELMMDWVKVVWKRRPGTLLNSMGCLFQIPSNDISHNRLWRK
jgi:hypothetical protein